LKYVEERLLMSFFNGACSIKLFSSSHLYRFLRHDQQVLTPLVKWPLLAPFGDNWEQQQKLRPPWL
jgi:hypothetical protein